VVPVRPLGEPAVLRRLAQGTEFRPVQYTAGATEKVFFCGCKHTAGQPMCDGTHKQYR
jgi:CDGSH-type Zn-finger protein